MSTVKRLPVKLKLSKKALPNFAKGLAEGCGDYLELRARVIQELLDCARGENPLNVLQVKALNKWLEETK